MEEFLKQNWLTLSVLGSAMLGFAKVYYMVSSGVDAMKNLGPRVGMLEQRVTSVEATCKERKAERFHEKRRIDVLAENDT